jgi:hypothetical protein
MGIVQEKFQVRPPDNPNDNASSGWRTDKSARVKKGLPGREGNSGGDWESKHMDNALFLHSLPPGTDLEDQELSDQRQFPMRMASEGDITPDYSAKAMKTGFTAHKCCPTDDQYTNEHADAFYDSIRVDGVEGFVERNNMLDRL